MTYFYNSVEAASKLVTDFENHAAGWGLYTKEVDSDNDALYIRIKRDGVLTEVRVYPPEE